MLADGVDPDDQGLQCLPVILLNAYNTLTKKHKVNVQASPLKGNLKNNTIQVSFGRGGGGGEGGAGRGGGNACFFGCTRLTQDTCTLHQRKCWSVILITIKVLNILGQIDLMQIRLLGTMISLSRVDTVLLFLLHILLVYAFTAIKKGDV